MVGTLALTLDRDDQRTLGTQVADAVRHQITDGRLASGTRLPSSRALASELGVARAVTEQAYAQLVAEGWLEGRHGSGTFVSAGAPLTRTSQRRRRLTPAAKPLVRLDAGTPWIDPRHDAGWRRAWRDVSAATPPRGYPDHRGLPELRAELADRLGRLRGVDCHPDEILITAGTTDGLRQLLGALPAGAVALDDPGYRAAARTIDLAGRRIVDVPPLGPPDAATLRGCAATYVTPAHQHPLGPTMPGGDRLALLDISRDGPLIVEDDYDSEFRYDVAPVPALAGLDRETVAYLGTASKAVAPSFRLGWLVAPPRLQDDLDRARSVTHDMASWPVQRAFLSMLHDGYVDKVIRSARRVYAERAVRVTEALAPHGHINGPIAGMYATLELTRPRAIAAHQAARVAGYDVPLLADYCRTHVRHGLVVGFGGCTEAPLTEALAAIVRGLDTA